MSEYATCVRCGHSYHYHGQTFCRYMAGDSNDGRKVQCDCVGWLDERTSSSPAQMPWLWGGTTWSATNNGVTVNVEPVE